ncbi:hypothetical protein MicB006_3392 [Micromonospora sp. B006]|nr:hypothetical protein MicB006_3392 [Micromonospora sp. B006]
MHGDAFRGGQARDDAGLPGPAGKVRALLRRATSTYRRR